MLLTGLLHLPFENLWGLKLPYLGVVTVLWITYLALRVRREPGLWREWGVRIDNLRSCLPFYVAVAVPVFLALLGWRLSGGGAPLGRGWGWVFLVYPAWAFVQEFALQGLLARNLRLAGLPEAAVVAAAGLAFGAAHLPDLPLAGMTAGVGWLWTGSFRRRPNLWILSLSHAWLGTLAFYWVLGRDPWLEMR
jgi:hypothetical protein